MKKKGLILLASAIMGLGLVGGTLAAWAVTDNADPFSVKVSPGNVQTDTTTKYVTLSWGASKKVSNVANLKLNTNRKVGVVSLLAQTGGDSVEGTFSATITGDAELIAKLNFDVYEGNLTETATDSGLISNDTLSAATKLTLTDGAAKVTVTNNTEKLLTPVVSLKDMTASEYSALASKSVTIEFDWGKTHDIVTTQTFYATGFGSDDVYVYAWDGEAQNAAWPGVKMTAAQVNGFKTAQVNITAYKKVIFHNNKSGDAEKKSGDIVIASSFTEGKNCFSYDANVATVKGTFSVHNDAVAAAYYLVGKNLSINSKAYTEETGWVAREEGLITLTSGTGSIVITTTGNAELKVLESTSNTWYSNDGNNFVISDAGEYTVTFNLNATNNQYISCVKNPSN